MKSILSRLSGTIAIGASTAVVAFGVLAPSSAIAMTVDSELSLIIDGSGSVGNTNFNTQLDAYKNVFSDPDTYNNLISKGSLGKIAVNLIQFGSVATEEIGYTLIDSVASSQAFANQIMGINRGGGSTNMTAALNLSASGLFSNAFSGNRSVIDLSTDGVPNSQFGATAASQSAISSGVDVINVLGIGSGINTSFLQNNIARGTNADGSNAFVVVANTFAEVESTLENKLAREIAPPSSAEIPTPALLPGLIGMGVAAFRKRKGEETVEA